MRRHDTRWSAARIAFALVVLAAVIAPAWREPVSSALSALPSACGDLAYSTEEDFVTQGPEPPDGDPLISDGDLLGPNCIICARNLDLVGPYDVSVDLGLDAVDVVDTETALVVFSTELDSPSVGQFTAGDLLATNGTVIPNLALTHVFTVGYDIGLDALHLVGDPRNIVTFLEEAKSTPRDGWLSRPEMLSSMLTQHKIDIWFSTEGTPGPLDQPAFLDGDLLSARDGIIVASNAVLLIASVPAGIPVRGVDYGLDAATSTRTGDREQIHFSTEILHPDVPSLGDGDVLALGDGIIASNADLVRCFEPKANQLGLDALHMVPSVARNVYLPITQKNFQITQ